MEEPDAKRLKTTSNESDVLSYGLVLERVGNCLKKDHVEALATIAELTLSEKDQVKSYEGNGSRILFNILEGKGIISRHDVGWLQLSLKEIKNEKAAKIVDEFTNTNTGIEFELPSEPEFSEEEDEGDALNPFENFLEKVGLKNKYPCKLTLKTFLQLGNNDQNSYVYIFWQKLTSLNYRAGLLQELVSQDYSMRDFIFCVLHCGDDFLRQDILEKMSACQLAVPVVLQGVEKNKGAAKSKPLFLLWALRRVMKKWRGQSDSFAIEQPIVSYPLVNISFLRIGDVRISKSQLMNTMLSYSQGYSSHTFFLNRDKDFVVPKVSPGTIECVWFLPMWESDNQIFKEVLAFLNLRGDCTKYPQQTAFACKAAHLTIALIATSKHKNYKECISQIRMNSKATLFISVSEEESRATTSKKVHRPKYKGGCYFVNVVQIDILSKTICEEIARNCKIANTAKTCLESLINICGENIEIDEQDEHCRNGRQAVSKIFESVKSLKNLDVLDFKKYSFPLQAIWKDLVEIDKASLHVETEVHKSFEHQMESKKLRKKEKRNFQFQTSLSPTMEVYLRIIKDARSNSALLQYIFGFMQEVVYHMVNENTKTDMNDIADLERDIRQIRDQKLKGSNQNGNGSKLEARNEFTYKLKVDKCNELYRSCRAKNLGGEHFLRELGQLYEAYMDLQEEHASQEGGTTALNVTLLPSLAARLVTEMQSLEIIDGDTGCVPLTWVTSVLDTLTGELNDPKVMVLSVIGVQSSGKSTLLNSMFGVRFPVRAGRCTRGLFIQLLKLSDGLSKELGFHYLVIVDSEGIRSIDHDDRRFDNELVTLALSIANVTIFNIEGENIGPDMTGILQIAAHALMRMKEVDLECHCRIVQQRVSDMTAADRNKANTKKIKETLDEATRFAAEEEGLEGRYQQFSDVVDLQVDEDLQYVPCLWTGGMAPPNHLYSETISKIKGKLFEDIKKGNIVQELTLSTFTNRVRDVWKAIKEEDFVFNFHDSVKAVDYNKFCLDYNQWIAQMRQDIQVKIGKVLSSVQADPETESLQPDVTILKDILEAEIKEQRCKLTTCVKDSIAKHPRKNTMLRHRQEFLHDVNVVLNETESHSLSKISDEYEIRKINLNLPHFRKKSRQILTREAKAEASKVTDTVAGLASYNFDTIWQNMMAKLKRDNNITRVTVTPSSLQKVCEKVLLKVTRDMAVGSEIQALLSKEGGITNHVSLEDCSKYISDKFVRSWVRYETASKTEKKEHISVEKKRQLKEEERENFVVEKMFPSSTVKVFKAPPRQSRLSVYYRMSVFREGKWEIIPIEVEKQPMDEKRQQAITFFRNIVEENFSQLQKQSKVFDANIFQLILRKMLKELSTKHNTLNIKLPHRIIAKGLLCFCGRSVKELCKSGDREVESYLDFGHYDILHSYLGFLHQEDQHEVAANYILYYLEQIFSEKKDKLLEQINNNIDYSQYTERVCIPWDLLYFLESEGDDIIYDDYWEVRLNYTLPDIVHIYVQFIESKCISEIQWDKEEKIRDYITEFIGNINQVQSQATGWKEWSKILGNSLGCPFIQSAGDIFQVVEVSMVSSMLEQKYNDLFYEDFNDGDFVNQTSIKNAAGLSYVCKHVCPMCGSWCDNTLESHTVHSSSLHRPRGLKGETYPVNDSVGNDLSSDSDSDSDTQSSSKSYLSDEYVPQYVLEDCFTSITSETATFNYRGNMVLCRKFKDFFPNWDIQPGKGNAANRLYWQSIFADSMENVESNIPESWSAIGREEVLESLERAKAAQLNGRKLVKNLPFKKRVLASCSQDS